jgi:hypothetical protein
VPTSAARPGHPAAAWNCSPLSTNRAARARWATRAPTPAGGMTWPAVRQAQLMFGTGTGRCCSTEF